MTDRVDLQPTDADLQYWIDTFIPTPELWWWDNAAVPNQHMAARVIPRGENRNDEIAGNITWVNAYLAWRMKPDTFVVIVDHGAWFAGLSEADQRRVRERQVALGRGKCVPLTRFGADADIPSTAIVDDLVVLDRALWHSLSEQTQRSVMKAELGDWDRATSYAVPNGAPRHIADIANRFVWQEGVNCLAVTAFAITTRQQDVLQWMMPDAFEDILCAWGYTNEGNATLRSGDVVVFRSESGDIIHAAYALSPDRLLNKSGQTSFNPVAIVNPQELQEDWGEFTMSVWKRDCES